LDLKELGNISPEGHWYYETKFLSIFGKLEISQSPETIVEIGAGSKFFIKKLLKKYPKAKGWAVDPYFTLEQLGIEGNLTSVRETPKINGDIYLFLDVLEHVENDLQLLQSSISTARSGATIVISVPAFEHLWSGHDIFLGHYRRYRTKDLRKLLVDANLEIEEIKYTFSLIYPLVWIVRKLKKGKIQSDLRPTNKILNRTALFILRKLQIFNSNRLFGLTAVAVARTR
jgi:hypothetical protein